MDGRMEDGYMDGSLVSSMCLIPDFPFLISKSITQEERERTNKHSQSA